MELSSVVAVAAKDRMPMLLPGRSEEREVDEHL